MSHYVYRGTQTLAWMAAHPNHGDHTGRRNRKWKASERRIEALRRDLPDLPGLYAERALIRARTATQAAIQRREQEGWA